MSYVADLTCSICDRIFRKPVTVICGHTFCNNCALRRLRKSPQCPTCFYPILGFQKLNVNLAIQAIVEQHLESLTPDAPEELRKGSEAYAVLPTDNDDTLATDPHGLAKTRTPEEIEILNRDPNIGTFGLNPTEVKCIGFRLVSPESFRYFVGTSYELEIDYHLSDELFKLLIPDHYFIGFNQVDKRDQVFADEERKEGSSEPRETYTLDWAALFLIERIVKFTISTVRVIARCKGHITGITASVLDFSNHAIVARMVNDANDGVYLDYLTGREIVLKQPTDIPVPYQRRIARIEARMCDFLNTLKDTNEIIAEEAIKRYGADSYGRKLSIDWNRDVHGFLNAVCSMLNLPPRLKSMVASHYNYQFRVDVVRDFLASASFESDPIFFLNYENKNFLSHLATHIGFLLALALFIVSVFYPKYSFWEFK